MHLSGGPAEILGRIDSLLDDYHALVMVGQADALPELAISLSEHLSYATQHLGDQVDASHRSQMVAMQSKATILGQLLARRLGDTQRSIGALETAGALQGRGLQGILYAPAGQTLSPFRSTFKMAAA